MTKKCFLILLAVLALLTPGDAQTDCTIDSLPWHENFTQVTNFRANCWEYLITSEMSVLFYPRVVTSDGTTFILFLVCSSQQCMASLPTMTVPAHWYKLHFSASAGGDGTQLSIGPAWTTANPTTIHFDTVATFVNLPSGYHNYEVLLPYNMVYNRRIAFHWKNGNYFNTNQVIIKDLWIEDASTCYMPLQGAISNIGTEEALLTWTPNCDIATNYQVQLMLEDSTLVMDTLTDPSADTLMLSRLNEHTHYLVRLRTLCDTNSSSWVGMDFTTLRHCHSAMVNIAPIAPHMAKVGWTPAAQGEPATSLEISCIDQAGGQRHDYTLTTSPGYLRGLTPGHNYQTVTRTVCGPWYEESDTTLLEMPDSVTCGIADLPYYIDFEEIVTPQANTTPPCWLYHASGGWNVTGWVYNINGNKLLSLQSYSDENSIATPLFDPQGQTLRVVFDCNKTDYFGRMIVGTMTERDNFATFDTVKVIQYESADDNWHEEEVYITPSDNNPVALAFHRPPTMGTTYWIDNLRVELATDCRRPSRVTVDAADTLAYVHWPAQGTENSQYQVRYRQASGAGATASGYRYVTTQDTACTLTGLVPDQAYEVWVRNLCDTTLWRPWISSGVIRTERSCYPLASARVAQSSGNRIGVEWTFDNSHHRQTTDVEVRWYADNAPSQTQRTLVSAPDQAVFLGPMADGTSYTIVLRPMCDSDSADEVVLHHTHTAEAYRPMLTAYTIDSTTIRLQWWGASYSYQLTYGNHAGGPRHTLTVNGGWIELEDLSPSSLYDFGLTEQQSGQRYLSDIVSAATDCGSLHIPYHVAYDGTAPACWTMAAANTGGSYPSPQFEIYRGIAVMPPMLEDPSNLDLHISFTNTSGFATTLRVGIAEDAADTNSITWLHVLHHNTQNPTQVDTIVNLQAYRGAGRRLAFGSNDNSMSISIDSIHLDYHNPCSDITELRIDTLEATQAQLSWSQIGAAVYYLVVHHGEVRDTLVCHDTTALIGLEPTTDYNAWVYGVCDVEHRSYNSPRLSFHTPCGPHALLPLVEDFNHSTRLPECWTAVTDVVTYGNHYPCIRNNMLYVSCQYPDSLGCIAATPLLPTHQFHASFKARTSYTDNPTVGLMSDLSNPATFIPLLSLPRSNSGMTLYEISTDTVALDPNELYYMVFVSHYNDLIIDDLRIDGLYQCRAPQYGTLEATTHRVEAHWQGTGADAYRVVCHSGTDSTVTITADTNATFGGLSASGYYSVTVQAICDSNTTDRLDLGSIYTDCDLAPLPYTNDFEQTRGTFYPTCWELAGSSSLAWTNYVDIDLEDRSNQVLYIDNASAITPHFVVPNERLQVRFKVGSLFDTTSGMGGGLMQCYTARVLDERVMLDSTMIVRYDNSVPPEGYLDFAFICDGYHAGDTIAVVIHGGSLPQEIKIDDFSIAPVYDTVWRHVEVRCDPDRGEVTGTGDYPTDSWVDISATSREGYRFWKWSDGSIDSNHRVFVTSDTLFYALFGTIAHDTLGVTSTAEPIVALYPNPAKGQVTLSVAEQATVWVTDASGRCVVPPTPCDKQMVLDCEGLPAGVYFVKAKTVGGTAIQKLILK